MSDEQHLPAIIDSPRMPALPTDEAEANSIYCSLPRTSQLEKAMIAQILSAELPSLTSAVNKVLLAKHLIATHRQKGELVLPWVAIICEDGAAYETYGKVPCNSIRNIIACMGKPPWSPPLPLDVKEWKGTVTTPNGEVIDGRSVVLSLNYESYRKLIAAPVAQAVRPGR